MVEILGGKDVVYYTDPLGTKHEPHKWWAERGLIHWESCVSGNYGSQPVRDTLQRLKALQDMIIGSRKQNGFMHHEQITTIQSYIDDMIPLCQRAREQGMPDDKNVTRQKAAEIKAKRRSKFVVVPGLASAF